METRGARDRIDAAPLVGDGRARMGAASPFEEIEVTALRSGSLADFCPKEWSTDGTSRVLIRCFYTANVPVIPPGASFTFPLGRSPDALVIVMAGKPPPTGTSALRHLGPNQWAVELSAREFAESVYTVLITPFRGDGGDAARLETAGGFVASIMSPSLLFRPCFENVQDLKTGSVEVSGEPFQNPAFLPTPAFSEKATKAVMLSYEMLERLKPRKAQRVRFSLRWYQAGLREERGMDAYVKLWIALEAIGMNEGATGPLDHLLALHYGSTAAAIRERFRTHDLAQLRNSIVHNGRTYDIDGWLLLLLAALYDDALRAKLGIGLIGRADRLVGSRSVRIRDFVTETRA